MSIPTKAPTQAFQIKQYKHVVKVMGSISCSRLPDCCPAISRSFNGRCEDTTNNRAIFLVYPFMISMICFYICILHIYVYHLYLPPKKKTHMNHTTPASTHQIVPCLATIIIPLAGTPGDTSTCAAETGSGIHLDSGK